MAYINLFKLKRLLQNPIVKHMVLLLISLLLCILFFCQGRVFGTAADKNDFSASVISISFMGFYLVIYSLIIILRYIIKKMNSLLFISLVFLLIITAFIAVVIGFILFKHVETINKEFEKITFTLNYLKENFYFRMFIIYLFPLAGAFFALSDEISAAQFQRKRAYESSLEAQQKKLLKYLFPVAADLNRFIEKDKYNPDCLFLNQHNFSRFPAKKAGGNIEFIQKEKLADTAFFLTFGELEIAGGLKCSEIATGDYYDVWLDKNTESNAENPYRLYLSLFDVEGHGIIANNPYIHEIRRFLAERKKNYSDKCPAETLNNFREHFNNYNTAFADDITVPAAFCTVDPDGTICFINSSHPDPMCITNGQDVEYFHLQKKVKQKEKSVYNREDQTRITLKQGEILLFCTDGLSVNYFRTMVNAFPGYWKDSETTAHLIKAILKDIKLHVREGQYPDDTAFFVIKKI